MDCRSGGQAHEQRGNRDESPPHGIGSEAERLEGERPEQCGVAEDDQRELLLIADADPGPADLELDLAAVSNHEGCPRVRNDTESLEEGPRQDGVRGAGVDEHLRRLETLVLGRADLDLHPKRAHAAVIPPLA
jgi:hypothetical protein